MLVQELNQIVKQKHDLVEAWFQTKLLDRPHPVYASVDLRNAGFKMGVVDTNLFPAGFNNLCETYLTIASQAFRDYVSRTYPQVRKVLLFPEEHTRNLFYWKNVGALVSMVEEAGFEVVIGSAASFITEASVEIPIDENKRLTVHQVIVEAGRLKTRHFDPDLIFVNNDLTVGIPDYLKNLSQAIVPQPALGWHKRRKSQHFRHMQLLMAELSEILELDPWLLMPLSTVETDIDLSDQTCLERLGQTVDSLLEKVRKKYHQHGIHQEPYAFIKNDSGTQGIGITHVSSGAEIKNMNKKGLKKLLAAKAGQAVSEFLIQEGIPTIDSFEGKVLEPVLYLVGGQPIGSFLRIHEKKGVRDNLNSPGMRFSCLCLHQYSCDKDTGEEEEGRLFCLSSLLGRVASCAAGLEGVTI